jgi:hypothetical protein
MKTNGVFRISKFVVDKELQGSSLPKNRCMLYYIKRGQKTETSSFEILKFFKIKILI